MNGWISVKERLPDIPDGKDRVKCIVATQNGRVTSMWLVRVGRNVQWEDCYGSVKPWFVTHWQPLPEPPKEEGAWTQKTDKRGVTAE